MNINNLIGRNGFVSEKTPRLIFFQIRQDTHTDHAPLARRHKHHRRHAARGACQMKHGMLFVFFQKQSLDRLILLVAYWTPHKRLEIVQRSFHTASIAKKNRECNLKDSHQANTSRAYQSRLRPSRAFGESIIHPSFSRFWRESE